MIYQYNETEYLDTNMLDKIIYDNDYHIDTMKFEVNIGSAYIEEVCIQVQHISFNEQEDTENLICTLMIFWSNQNKAFNSDFTTTMHYKIPIISFCDLLLTAINSHRKLHLTSDMYVDIIKNYLMLMNDYLVSLNNKDCGILLSNTSTSDIHTVHNNWAGYFYNYKTGNIIGSFENFVFFDSFNKCEIFVKDNSVIFNTIFDHLIFINKTSDTIHLCKVGNTTIRKENCLQDSILTYNHCEFINYDNINIIQTLKQKLHNNSIEEILKYNSYNDNYNDFDF